MTSQSQWFCILPRFVAKRNNTHSYQVTTMNSLETFSYRSFEPLLKCKCIIHHEIDLHILRKSQIENATLNSSKLCIKELTNNVT
jgi:hypothetical protein